MTSFHKFCAPHLVGVERFELPVLLSSRFQSETAPKLPFYTPLNFLFLNWGDRRGSNAQRPESQSGILPIELRPRAVTNIVTPRSRAWSPRVVSLYVVNNNQHLKNL